MEQGEQTPADCNVDEKQADHDGARLYAQPYDISACGFFFSSAEEYLIKAGRLRNGFGQPVEEFEIQFCDGETVDAELFRALGIHQGNFPAFLKACREWDLHGKVLAIIAAGKCGHAFGPDFDPEGFDIDLYEMGSMRELAWHFVDEGLFGEIPAHVQNYLDFDAMARDLSMDYGEIRVAGTNYVYRCD